MESCVTATLVTFCLEAGKSCISNIYSFLKKRICLLIQETWVPSLSQEDSPGEGDDNLLQPGKPHRPRSLAGYSSWGCRVRHDLETKQQQLSKTLLVFKHFYHLSILFRDEQNKFAKTSSSAGSSSSEFLARVFKYIFHTPF